MATLSKPSSTMFANVGDAIPRALTEIVALGGVGEAVMLSTCNRTEIYVEADSEGATALLDWLKNDQGLSAEAQDALFEIGDEAAVRHLFRVACGLDSMILGEPQILGQLKDSFREADATPQAEGATCPLRPALAMRPWPTFRMTFRGFQKAYPQGTVFINKPPSNPVLFLFDMVLEIVFSATIDRQHREARPVMDNMTHYDDRLPNKAYVWGVDFGDDAVCWTDDFVMEQNNVVNAEVGGQPLVVAWDPHYESLGVWYNDSDAPVTEIDFFGNTPAGQLKRVEVLKSGLFWHVWAEFFPQTDVNRLAAVADQDAV